MSQITTLRTATDGGPTGRGRRHAPLVLMAAILLAFGALRLATIDGPVRLDAALSDAVTFAAGIVIESLSFVLLGVGVSIVVQLWVPMRVIAAVLPRSKVARRAVLSLLGVVFPVCECGNVPLARGLMNKGLSVSDAMTFLLAAPILNPITIITTYQAFGWSDGILVARLAGGFVLANLVGWLFDRHPDPEALLTRRFAQSCHHDDRPSSSRAIQAAQLFAHEMSAMLPALFIGAAVAGLIQVAIPRELMDGVGGHLVWGVIALMVLAFMIAICSSVDAFFALSLASSFSPGALAAFLIFGPMIDVKMVAMLRTTFKGRTILIVAGVCALGTLVIGLGVNLLV
ncbi:MAG TPA: permease [Arachnia sp.]|nr:permease [Arachnia sp.]HMT86419.1 permease [Arachnia sp.]